MFSFIQKQPTLRQKAESNNRSRRFVGQGNDDTKFFEEDETLKDEVSSEIYDFDEVSSLASGSRCTRNHYNNNLSRNTNGSSRIFINKKNPKLMTASKLLSQRRSMKERLERAAAARGMDGNATLLTNTSLYTNSKIRKSPPSVVSKTVTRNNKNDNSPAKSTISHASSRKNRIMGGGAAKLIGPGPPHTPKGQTKLERIPATPETEDETVHGDSPESARSKNDLANNLNDMPNQFSSTSYAALFIKQNQAVVADDISCAGDMSILGMQGIEDNENENTGDVNQDEILQMQEDNLDCESSRILYNKVSLERNLAKGNWNNRYDTIHDGIDSKLSDVEENSYITGSSSYGSDYDDSYIDSLSEASLPTLLMKQNFHACAEAAVASLLKPTPATPTRKVTDKYSSNVDKYTPPREEAEEENKESSSFLTPQGVVQGPSMNAPSSPSIMATSFKHFPENPRWSKTEEIPKDRMSPLLTAKTAELLEKCYDKLKPPSKTLARLITNIFPPKKVIVDENGEMRLSSMDRAYMTRRKNACGALKVLTANNKKNCISLCWTIGVLPSITSVLNDAGENGPEAEFEETVVIEAYRHSRKRALIALFNMCKEPKNKILIFHSPGLVQALGKILKIERDETLPLACSCLVLLAKEVENRLLMLKVPGMLDALLGVIQPPMKEVQTTEVRDLKDMDYRNKYLEYYMDGSNSGEMASGNSDGIMGTGHEGIVRQDSSDDSMSTDDHLNKSLSSGSTPQLGNKNLSDKSVKTNMLVLNESDEDESTERIENESKSLEGVELSLPTVEKSYDSESNNFLVSARLSVFAILAHLCKAADNAYIVCREKKVMTILLEIAGKLDSPSHARSMTVLAQLSRHPDNAGILVHRILNAVPTLVKGTFSSDDSCRKHACVSIQNLTYDPSYCQVLANQDQLIAALCECAASEGNEEEQIAAVTAIRNLTEEGSCVIALCNTNNCMPLLMQLSEGKHENTNISLECREKLQYLACDALATLSHHLRKIATTALANNETRQKADDTYVEKLEVPEPPVLFVPTFRSFSWNQWH